MSGSSAKKWQILQDLVMLTVPPFLIWYVLRNYFVNQDTSSAQNKLAAKRLETILDRREQDDEDNSEDDDPSRDTSHERRAKRRTPRSQDIVLNQYEHSIASGVVHPDDIPVSFADIGGLESIISDLQESVIYPLTMPSIYQHSSALLSAPSGVLLYGPPGCGKTMLAKALAHESGAVFINVHISTLTEKWFGDSNKLVAAVFSLARKLAPSIVFIDEIDTLLGSRRSGDHEASSHMKAEMMTHMDGLTSGEKGTGLPQRVLVLGATNRPHDIDDAILRRMPKRFAIGLPNKVQRRRILELLLRDMKLADPPTVDPDGHNFDMEVLVQGTEGMSGSDIKETCREAAMMPVREAIQRRREGGQPMKGMKPGNMRALRTEDFTANLRSKTDIAEDARLQIEELRQVAKADDGDTDGYVTTDDEESSDAERRPQRRSRKEKARGSKPRDRRKRSDGALNGAVPKS
ncbi:MAG: hypothetical protein M1828_006612 [Chrysothrix sp. TS-e1954]|nr:MAG: hypothetical protein M1828_006612 [Chrysothrix sp. TS-e1954]